MTQVRDVLGRARPLAVAVAFVAASFIPLLSIHSASAGAITDRSLLVTSTVPSNDPLSTGSPDPGTATNGDEVGHTYGFTTSGQAAGAVATIHFIVCDEAFGYLDNGADCIAPTGFDNALSATGVGITLSTGTVTATTRVDANEWTLTVTGLTLTGTPTALTATFDANSSYFVNPDMAYLDPARAVGAGPVNGTYFAHVSLLTTGPVTTLDEGTVTNAVATAIDINTRVQETLKFSVEGDMRNATPNDNSGAPLAGVGAFNGATPPTGTTACDPLTGNGTIRMGDADSNALSTDVMYDAVSYFRLATNSAQGALVYYAGETLTSGLEDIDEVGAPAVAGATPGADEQFGLAFMPTNASNTVVASPVNEGDLYPAAGYADDAVGFGFVSSTTSSDVPQPLAQSDGIVQCETGAVRYIANIVDDTAAGIYDTRVVYIAAPTY
jgi:hypothetical protein